MPMTFGPMDPTVILLLGAIVLGLVAQGWVSSAFRRFSRVRSMRGVTGAQVARDILDRHGLGNVPVERVAGRLSDHYDPKAKALRLSEEVFASPSLAAIGVAAHEAGHAIQDAKGFVPFGIRNGIFPLANIGSQMLWPAVIGGIVFGVKPLLWIGIVLYAFAVLFSVVTLPVEFDASRRALSLVTTGGYLTAEEKTGARKVLTAAAMTYVAATLVAVLQLIRLLYLSRSDD